MEFNYRRATFLPLMIVGDRSSLFSTNLLHTYRVFQTHRPTKNEPTTYSYLLSVYDIGCLIF